jgi:hypothetical protein
MVAACLRTVKSRARPSALCSARMIGIETTRTLIPCSMSFWRAATTSPNSDPLAMRITRPAASRNHE